MVKYAPEIIDLLYCDIGNFFIFPPYTPIKRHFSVTHFSNAVVRVQIQQTAVHGEGQKVDPRTCRSEEYGKSLWFSSFCMEFVAHYVVLAYCHFIYLFDL